MIFSEKRVGLHDAGRWERGVRIVPELYYQEALKLGQKEVRSCAAKGISATLPVLDEILPAGTPLTATDLGVVQIPTEWIIGTKSFGRSSSFARNFMPLLEVGTEFAAKWQALCLSHLAEGIRNSVKVWEYMNRYYVVEGNKRVSVLKFFGSPVTSAEVLRILPERTGDKETELYYELLDFQRLSRINSVEFSRLGSCAEMQRLMGKGPDEIWSDDDRAAFSSVLSIFREAYRELGGNKLSVTPGEALLACLRVFGYQELRGRTRGEMRTLVSQAWEEILLSAQSEPVEVRLEAGQEKKASLLTKVLPISAKVYQAAFLHDRTPQTSGWTSGHELGRQYAERVLSGRVVTRAYFNVTDGDPESLIEEAIRDGASILFTTSPRLLPASLRAAAGHPEVTILNCSLNVAHRYVRSYYARMYEAKFIIGAIAGALAGSNDVGYIADYPIYGQIAGINAFAFGVEMVNPRSRVLLEWSGTGSAAEAAARLSDKGIRLISCQDHANLHNQGRSSFGLSVGLGDERTVLAAPIWEWGVYYEKMLRRIMDGSSREEYAGSARALNYYWGMSDGVVSLSCSDKLPEGIRRLARVLIKSVRGGLCDPFRGVLRDQRGREMVSAHNSLSPEQIIAMDWLAETVVGEIPPYEALTEVGKATVDLMGVPRSARSSGEKSGS